MPNPKEEFQYALHEIAYYAPTLDSPYDRVRLAEWVRRLSLEAKLHDFQCNVVNPYAQLLRIQVRAGRLRSPFHVPPNQGDVPALAVTLSKEILASVPSLPTPGPTAPFMCRKSKDGHAYVSARQIPGKGVLCYLAVSTGDFHTN
ncbi:Major DNA-binding protein [Frankliniella fusca]|uniref:Major DNA-binding protein n=1 Tax=Frankliniella fusca TaxID=407009 RepID=A0AAE1L6A0_9NEOP|nr:Major DNA-binding protein [Frankliniella fusca]